MGAILITYIVTGPKEIELTAEQREAIIAQANETKSRLVAEIIEESGENNLKTAIEETGFNPELAPYLEDESGVAKALDELLKIWHSLPRDANARDLPGDDSRIIYVAGEMSWGDGPFGLGFTTLDNAAHLGLFPLLGME